jgi:hypothetical protein
MSTSYTRRGLRAAATIAIALVGGSLTGCAGSSEPATTEAEPTSTAGGESEVGASTEPTLAESLELPTTTLIPVPSSGVPRHLMSAALQDLWRSVEDASAMAPPEFDGEASIDAINAWVEEEFVPWTEARTAVTLAILESARALPPGSAEAGIGGALVGYTLEEFVIAFRGAPIPEAIATDAELLEIFLASLTNGSQLIARQAGSAYGVCARTLAPLGPDSPWVEWAQYCLFRGQEVNEVYGLEE